MDGAVKLSGIVAGFGIRCIGSFGKIIFILIVGIKLITGLDISPIPERLIIVDIELVLVEEFGEPGDLFEFYRIVRRYLIDIAVVEIISVPDGRNDDGLVGIEGVLIRSRQSVVVPDTFVAVAVFLGYWG